MEGQTQDEELKAHLRNSSQQFSFAGLSSMRN